jgi:hypothetical protein
VGALLPAAVGFAVGSKGLGGALVYGVGYLIDVLALLGLPETRGAGLAWEEQRGKDAA